MYYTTFSNNYIDLRVRWLLMNSSLSLSDTSRSWCDCHFAFSNLIDMGSIACTMLQVWNGTDLFSEVIWVVITVEENGLLGVTQQMSRIGDFATPQQQQFENYQSRLRDQMAVVPVSLPAPGVNAVPSTPLPSPNAFGVSACEPNLSLPPETTGTSPASRWLLQVIQQLRINCISCSVISSIPHLAITRRVTSSTLANSLLPYPMISPF